MARDVVSEQIAKHAYIPNVKMGLRDMKWSQTFYKANISINNVRHPAFIKARILNKLPTYHAEGKNLLDDA